MNYYVEGSNASFGYTDLVIERRRANTENAGVDYKKWESDGGKWECVSLHTEGASRELGKPRGTYYTLHTERMDLLSEGELYDVQEEIARVLCEMCEKERVFPGRILVVGLGNEGLTPDSIGVKSALNVRPTLHIYNEEPDFFEELECSEIAVVIPGVASNTGLDSAEIVKSISRRIAPDLLICIDAIATNSRERLGTTIQLANSGIIPGSGVGNKIGELSYDTVGAPVFAIGIPTLINSRVLCSSDSVKDTSSLSDMLVAPREIDEIIKAGARIIGGAINQAFGIGEI